MQPEDRVAAYLWDMLQAAKETVTMIDGVSIKEFRKNLILKRAVERSLEIIGEAARRIPPDYAAKQTQIPWRQIIGLYTPDGSFARYK